MPRDPRGNDRRTLDVVRENRLAAHAESSQRIDHQAIDPCDPRWVLAMQTQARLQGAVLTPEHRDQLLQSGRRLGLRAFESNLVIAVVQDKARRSQPLQLAQPTLSLVGEGIEHDSVGAAKPTARPTLAFARWFLVGASYWLFQGRTVEAFTPLQVQPNYVDVGPAATDPTTFPSDWLLSAPGEYQHYWARLVVSPELAAWHDLYLLGLTALLVAAVVPGRARRPLLAIGGVVAAVAVVLQLLVAP